MRTPRLVFATLHLTQLDPEKLKRSPPKRTASPLDTSPNMLPQHSSVFKARACSAYTKWAHLAQQSKRCCLVFKRKGESSCMMLPAQTCASNFVVLFS